MFSRTGTGGLPGSPLWHPAWPSPYVRPRRRTRVLAVCTPVLAIMALVTSVVATVLSLRAILLQRDPRVDQWGITHEPRPNATRIQGFRSTLTGEYTLHGIPSVFLRFGNTPDAPDCVMHAPGDGSLHVNAVNGVYTARVYANRLDAQHAACETVAATNASISAARTLTLTTGHMHATTATAESAKMATLVVGTVMASTVNGTQLTAQHAACETAVVANATIGTARTLTLNTDHMHATIATAESANFATLIAGTVVANNVSSTQLTANDALWVGGGRFRLGASVDADGEHMAITDTSAPVMLLRARGVDFGVNATMPAVYIGRDRPGRLNLVASGVSQFDAANAATLQAQQIVVPGGTFTVGVDSAATPVRHAGVTEVDTFSVRNPAIDSCTRMWADAAGSVLYTYGAGQCGKPVAADTGTLMMRFTAERDQVTGGNQYRVEVAVPLHTPAGIDASNAVVTAGGLRVDAPARASLIVTDLSTVTLNGQLTVNAGVSLAGMLTANSGAVVNGPLVTGGYLTASNLRTVGDDTWPGGGAIAYGRLSVDGHGILASGVTLSSRAQPTPAPATLQITGALTVGQGSPSALAHDVAYDTLAAARTRPDGAVACMRNFVETDGGTFVWWRYARGCGDSAYGAPWMSVDMNNGASMFRGDLSVTGTLVAARAYAGQRYVWTCATEQRTGWIAATIGGSSDGSVSGVATCVLVEFAYASAQPADFSLTIGAEGQHAMSLEGAVLVDNAHPAPVHGRCNAVPTMVRCGATTEPKSTRLIAQDAWPCGGMLCMRAECDGAGHVAMRVTITC